MAGGRSAALRQRVVSDAAGGEGGVNDCISNLTRLRLNSPTYERVHEFPELSVQKHVVVAPCS